MTSVGDSPAAEPARGAASASSGPYVLKAFVSYSHAVDSRLAPAIRDALHAIGKPWWRLRSMRVFRDTTGLTANPSLWGGIEAALTGSEYLLLLASPEAARSPWVTKEVEWWLRNRRADRLLILLTEGEIAWSAEAGNFDWARTTALPVCLDHAFAEEPLYIDFRWARDRNDLHLRHAQFRSAVLRVAAPLLGRAIDELDGEDVRQHRIARAVAGTATAVLAVVAAFALVQWFAAARERREAIAQRDLALERGRIGLSRQLAAQSKAALALGHIDVAALLGAEAMAVSETRDALDSLVATAAYEPALVTVLHGHAAPVVVLSASFDGRRLLSADADGTVVVWDIERRSAIRTFSHTSGTENPLFGGYAALRSDGRAAAIAIADTTTGGALRVDVHDLDAGTVSQLTIPVSPDLPASFIDGLWFANDGSSNVGAVVGQAVLKWETGTGGLVEERRFRPWTTMPAVSAVTATRSLLATSRRDGIHTILLWSLDAARPMHVSGSVTAQASITAVHPMGNRLVYWGDSEGRLGVWNWASGHRYMTQLAEMGSAPSVTAIGVNPRTSIVAGTGNGLLSFWQLDPEYVEGREPTIFQSERAPIGSGYGVTRLAFLSSISSPHHLIASGTSEGHVMLWHMEHPPGRLEAGPGIALAEAGTAPQETTAAGATCQLRLAVSPTGDMELCDDDADELRGPLSDYQRLTVRTVADRRIVASITSKKRIGGAAFSSDGHTIAGLEAWGMQHVRFWDARGGQPLGEPIPLNPPRRTHIRFSGDGRALYLYSKDGEPAPPSVIKLDPKTLIDVACSLAGRTLTSAERARLMPGEPERSTCAAQ